MLRADGLTLAAFHAVRGFSAVGGVQGIVPISIPVVVDHFDVHCGEQIRDGDVLWAALHAVPAGGAGDQVHLVENLLDLVDGGHFLLVQGFEVLHVAEVIFHLGHVAHTGEDHSDTGEACGESDGVAGGGAAVETLQHGLCFLRQVYQIAALHRFHDDDRFVVLPTDLVALTTLDGGIFKVYIIELNLHDFDFRVFRENLLQNLGRIVEGDAYMANFPLRFQSEGRFVGVALLEMGENFLALGVHQVKVQIVYAQGLQLTFKEGADVRFTLEIHVGEFVRQDVAFPGVAVGQGDLQGLLTLALQIAAGSVEIVEAGGQKRVYHPFCFVQVHFFTLHGQAHTAEAKVLFDFLHGGNSFLI